MEALRDMRINLMEVREGHWAVMLDGKILREYIVDCVGQITWTRL